MADVVFIVVAVVFFGLCVTYVRGLDRLVRSVDDTPGDAATPVDQLTGGSEGASAGSEGAPEAVDENR